MNRFYRGLAWLSFLAIVLFSVVSIAPDPRSRVFLKLCRSPTAWDIAFREDRSPVGDLTAEEIKTDLMHFASVYRSESEIWLATMTLVALVIFIFSVTGWLRERHFRKAATPKTSD